MKRCRGLAVGAPTKQAHRIVAVALIAPPSARRPAISVSIGPVVRQAMRKAARFFATEQDAVLGFEERVGRVAQTARIEQFSAYTSGKPAPAHAIRRTCTSTPPSGRFRGDRATVPNSLAVASRVYDLSRASASRARSGIRTHTPFRTADFESAASTIPPSGPNARAYKLRSTVRAWERTGREAQRRRARPR